VRKGILKKSGRETPNSSAWTSSKKKKKTCFALPRGTKQKTGWEEREKKKKGGDDDPSFEKVHGLPGSAKRRKGKNQKRGKNTRMGQKKRKRSPLAIFRPGEVSGGKRKRR